MNPKKIKQLKKKYPKLFIGLYCIECNDGWYDLINDCCSELMELFKKHKPEFSNNYYFVQIKEKFGGIRLYTNRNFTSENRIINKYEEKSFEVCEICGRTGELRTDRPWLKTLCNYHNSQRK